MLFKMRGTSRQTGRFSPEAAPINSHRLRLRHRDGDGRYPGGVVKGTGGARSQKQIDGGHWHKNVGRDDSSQNHRATNQHPKVSTSGDNRFMALTAAAVPPTNL